MGLQCGIVGLPNAGKSTLFNALTSLQVPAEIYPFSTIEPNVGLITLPDKRLDELAKVSGCAKTTPSWIKLVDIAGLVKGASRGEGLGNKFLGHIREMDALIQVVRGFAVGDISHPLGKIDSLEDIKVVNTELCLSDLKTVDNRLAKDFKSIRKSDAKSKKKIELLTEIKEELNKGLKPRLDSRGKKELATELSLLMAKPCLYILNVSEKEAGEENNSSPELEKYIKREGSHFLSLPVLLEEEVSRLPASEQKEMRVLYGLKEDGLTLLVREIYSLLKLVTFFTVKGGEAKAWAVPSGTTARQGAGKVHTDMEKGFIKAEVVSCQNLLKATSLSRAREVGWLRGEGKNYLLQDGDVVLFHFRT